MAALITQSELIALVPAMADVGSAALDSFILSASAAVEAYCRRSFLATDYDERYTASGVGQLFLRQIPVISIASIEAGRTNPSTLDPATYDFDPESGEVRSIGGDPFWDFDWWPAGWPGWSAYSPGFGNWRNIRIRYRAGYSGTDSDPTSGVPPDIKQAVTETTKSLQRSAARDPQIQSMSQQGRTISYATGTAVLQPIEGAAASLLIGGGWKSYR